MGEISTTDFVCVVKTEVFQGSVLLVKEGSDRDPGVCRPLIELLFVLGQDSVRFCCDHVEP